jgi:hypothetical protein
MHKAESAASGAYDKPRGWMRATDATDVGYNQPSPVVVQAAPKPPTGVKTGKKYVLATDATDVCYTQRSLTRARAHARAYRELEISVATVADFHSESPRESERTVATVAESGASKRIAGELVKMHKDGAISGPNDPEAEFYAQVLHTFGGSYRGAPDKKEAPLAHTFQPRSNALSSRPADSQAARAVPSG